MSPSSPTQRSALARLDASAETRHLMSLGEAGLRDKTRRLARGRRRALAFGALMAVLGLVALAMVQGDLPRLGFEPHSLLAVFLGLWLFGIPGAVARWEALGMRARALALLSDDGDEAQAEAAILAKSHPQARRVIELAAAQGRQLRAFDLQEMREIAKRREGEKARRLLARMSQAPKDQEGGGAPSEPPHGR